MSAGRGRAAFSRYGRGFIYCGIYACIVARWIVVVHSTHCLCRCTVHMDLTAMFVPV